MDRMVAEDNEREETESDKPIMHLLQIAKQHKDLEGKFPPRDFKFSNDCLFTSSDILWFHETWNRGGWIKRGLKQRNLDECSFYALCTVAEKKFKWMHIALFIISATVRSNQVIQAADVDDYSTKRFWPQLVKRPINWYKRD